MIVKLPEDKVTDGSGEISSLNILDEFILPLPYWKQNDLKVVDASIDLQTAIDKAKENNTFSLELSNDTKGHVLQAMTLLDGNSMVRATIPSPKINRLYSKILRAFHVSI